MWGYFYVESGEDKNIYDYSSAFLPMFDLIIPEMISLPYCNILSMSFMTRMKNLQVVILYLKRLELLGNVMTAVLCICFSMNSNIAPLNDNYASENESEYIDVSETADHPDIIPIGYPAEIRDLMNADKIHLQKTRDHVDRNRRILDDYSEYFCSLEAEQETAEDQGQIIADIAESMIGTPYQYAGESEAGVDCSGLVVYCYAQLGIDLPHSSYSMCNVGEEVSVDDIRPGDIICWDNQGGSCGHVGIYVGDGMMVDARGSNEGVIYGDLDLHPILTVRRIFN